MFYAVMLTFTTLAGLGVGFLVDHPLIGAAIGFVIGLLCLVITITPDELSVITDFAGLDEVSD